MKTIYFSRHGKAQRKRDGLTDLRRSLTKQGKKEVRAAARALRKKQSPGFDWIISSPAVRAMESAHIIIDTIGSKDLGIFADEAAYSADSYEKAVDLLTALDDSKSIVLFVSHSPVLSDIIQCFIPEMKDIIPTAGIVGIAFDVERWKDITTVRPEVIYADISRKKPKRSVLTLKARENVREKSISFLVMILKDLEIIHDSIPEEILAAAHRKVTGALFGLIEEVYNLELEEVFKRKDTSVGHA
jgi:phosphohistidine phosphatase